MQDITYSDFYTEKINKLTLQEAFELHYKLNPLFTPYYKFETPEGRSGIKAHDIIHVIFGCDTSFLGEHRVQTWFKYACVTNLTFMQKVKYLIDKDSRKLLTPTGLIKFVLTHQSELKETSKRVKEQASQMTKKWDYFNEASYLQKTIGEIRKEFNIQIVPN